MQKTGKGQITLVNETGQTIFTGKITSLILTEELIIKKSIEFFNDDSPCFIHRSAVMKRLFVELEDFLQSSSNESESQLFWKDLPENIKNILDGIKDVHSVSYKML